MSEEKMMHFACRKKISWSAVLSGALVILGISFLLGLFSIAISLTAFVSKGGALAISIGGLIGVAICIITAMFVGGFVAGMLGRPFCRKRNLGILYGFNAWCVALILLAVLSVPLMRYVVNYTHFLSGPNANFGMLAPAMQSTIPTASNPTAENIAMTAFIMFALFFLSAFSSCFGGYCGMNCKCGEDECGSDIHK